MGQGVRGHRRRGDRARRRRGRDRRRHRRSRPRAPSRRRRTQPAHGASGCRSPHAALGRPGTHRTASRRRARPPAAVTPRLRKVALTLHVVSSVGWLGAVAVFLALAIVGLASQDSQLVRAVYLAAEPVIWFVIIPLAFASLLTGLVQSLGTTWGLFQHYWVLFKLLIAVVATAVLLMYTQTVDDFADLAAQIGRASCRERG